MKLWFSFILLTGALAISFIKENIVFEKVNEISTTRSKWLVAFVIDIDPYSALLNRLNVSIKAVEERLLKFAFNNRGRIRNSTSEKILNVMSFEKDNLRKTRDYLWQELTEIQSMHQDPMSRSRRSLVHGFYQDPMERSRRSLFPIIGKALSFLFGTLSDSDLSAIRDNVRTLAQGQATIKHVLNSSLTVLKTVQGQTANNTVSINGIIDIIENLEQISENITSNVATIQDIINIYTTLDRAVTEVQNLIDMARDHAQNLKLQLNMLSLGHLSPAVISPKNLRKLLLEVGSQLGRHFRFPFNPDNDLWTFYKTLTCTTLIEYNKLVVVLSIPLLDTIGTFEAYKVYNLAIPRNVSNQTNILARYDIEAPALLINKRRTQFALLSEAELSTCSAPLRPYCTIRNPVYSAMPSQMCIIQLFYGAMDKIARFCKVLVTPNAPNPQARYLSDGHWVITSAISLTFSVLCNTTTHSRALVTKPPIDIISIPLACSAFNSFMTLMPYFHKESKYTLSEPFKTFLRHYRMGLINVWKPFELSLPSFGDIKIPSKLKENKEIPLDNLIFALQNSNSNVEPMPASIPDYYYWIGVGLGTVILVLIFRFRRRLQNYFCKFKICSWSAKGGTVEDPPCPAIKGPDQPSMQQPTAPTLSDSDQELREHQPPPTVISRKKYRTTVHDPELLRLSPEDHADIAKHAEIAERYRTVIHDPELLEEGLLPPWESYSPEPLDDYPHEDPVHSPFLRNAQIRRKIRRRQKKERHSFPRVNPVYPDQMENHPSHKTEKPILDNEISDSDEDVRQSEVLQPSKETVTSETSEHDATVRLGVSTNPSQQTVNFTRTTPENIASIYPSLTAEIRRIDN